MIPGSNILILGKGGQLSNALAALLGTRATFIGQDEADFMDADFTGKLEALTRNETFACVINAAAYTAVDTAETGGKEQAMRINGAAVGELAAWCKKRALPLVHYSTDYVFDGSGERPWRETDTPHPLNAYGQSKREGERLLAATGGEYLLFRTSWLYDATGKNFFTTIRRLLREKESLNVVADQIGAPTYVPHLALATLQALSGIPQWGIYHLCNAGETSWHGFASAIFAHERAQAAIKCQSVNPIPTSAYPLPAPRPRNSRLDCTRAKERLGIAMPDWEDGLRTCFESKHEQAV